MADKIKLQMTKPQMECFGLLALLPTITQNYNL